MTEWYLKFGVAPRLHIMPDTVPAGGMFDSRDQGPRAVSAELEVPGLVIAPAIQAGFGISNPATPTSGNGVELGVLYAPRFLNQGTLDEFAARVTYFRELKLGPIHVVNLHAGATAGFIQQTNDEYLEDPMRVLNFGAALFEDLRFFVTPRVAISIEAGAIIGTKYDFGTDDWRLDYRAILSIGLAIIPKGHEEMAEYISSVSDDQKDFENCGAIVASATEYVSNFSAPKIDTSIFQDGLEEKIETAAKSFRIISGIRLLPLQKLSQCLEASNGREIWAEGWQKHWDLFFAELKRLKDALTDFPKRAVALEQSGIENYKARVSEFRKAVMEAYKTLGFLNSQQPYEYHVEISANNKVVESRDRASVEKLLALLIAESEYLATGTRESAAFCNSAKEFGVIEEECMKFVTENSKGQTTILTEDISPATIGRRFQ